MNGLEFAHPWMLAGLALLPYLAWRLGRRGPMPSLSLPTLKPLQNLARTPRRHPGGFRWIIPLLALALIFVAAARPRTPQGNVPDPTQGIDIMLTLDYSRSMAEHDFQLQGKRVSRREALLHVVEDFVQKRPNDRIGIVGFARSPFLISPLTLDHDWALQSLKETDFATGTAIGEGLAAGLQSLKDHSDRSRVVILVTDGMNMQGRPPLQIAPALMREKVRLYSILIGPDIVTPSMAARHELNRASRMTGGQFFQARDTETLQSIYGSIDQLEKKALLQKRFMIWREWFPWFAGSALGLILVHTLWNELFRRRIP